MRWSLLALALSPLLGGLVTVTAPAANTPLVEYDEIWSYHKGTNAPQGGWKTLPDSGLDGTWTNGLGGFGYADNAAETNLCQTVLADMKGRYSTLFLRKQFSIVSSVDTNLHLMLTMDWDDGFIAWLDGVYLTNAYVSGAPAEPAYAAVSNGSHESSHGNTSPQPSVTYDFGPIGSRLGDGTHTLALAGLNESLAGSSDFVQIADLYLAPAPLVSSTEVWRYRRGTNAPPSNWKTVADASLDASWASGPGGFGYADNVAETNLCHTIVADMKNSYTTLYMRKQFTASAGVETNLHLMLTMDWDDGFIAWLDGRYLVSEFVAGAPTEPAYSALASAEHESSRGNNSPLPPTTYDLGAVGTRLAPGVHTLAVMGLNAASGSSDFIQIADLSVDAAPTPPPPITNFPAGWRFVFFGDARGNSSSAPVDTQILGELARAATNERPAFVLFSGDLVYDGNLGLPAFQIWTNAMSPLYRARIPIYPILGNHDAQGIGPATFTNLFGHTLPADGPAGELFRTYSFTHSNALILALDNYITLGTVNQPWINAVLATNHLPHIFSMGHVSAFQVTTDHRSMAEYSTPAKRDAFWNSLRNAGAEFYLCGHYHFYDHARIDDGDGDPSDDLHQFVLGAGGAPPMTDPPTYPGVNAPWTPRPIYHDFDYGYGLVNVDGPTVTITWMRRAGPNNFEPGGDQFIYISPRVPIISLARQGADRVAVLLSHLLPGKTNLLEVQPALSDGGWQVVTQIVSAGNTAAFTLQLPAGTNSSFLRVRAP